jgi:hypothetical protein
MITHRVSGLLYEGSLQSLVSCMKEVMLDPVWARELGLKGREKASGEFTIENCSGLFMDEIARSIPEKDNIPK